MGEIKYTKGPWGLGMRSGHNGNLIYARDGKDSFEDSVICSIMGLWSYKDIDEQSDADPKALANGKLISAAPELLEALESLWETAQDRGWLGRDDDSEGVNQVLAAIAKARGEA